eukprot:scaffold256426_cov20-Tisochrysis_lutea.AAC.2
MRKRANRASCWAVLFRAACWKAMLTSASAVWGRGGAASTLRKPKEDGAHWLGGVGGLPELNASWCRAYGICECISGRWHGSMSRFEGHGGAAETPHFQMMDMGTQ